MRGRLTIFLAVALASVPMIAYAATPKNFCELVNFFVSIFNALTGSFVLAALVSYLYGITMNIKSSEESRTTMRRIILWGILGLFIMVSVWGILRILQETLFQAGPGGSVQSARAC